MSAEPLVMTDAEAAERLSRFGCVPAATDAEADTSPALQIRGDINDLVSENASLQERVDWHEQQENHIRALFTTAGLAFTGTLYDMVEALIDASKGEF